ncbi:succinate--hydroxymethylglutarate CoA-transferase-like isoform X2 [Corticium candelabrum]|nr:succinate--hydroxymethylglutarate CoA-transferase-like isoform X2 [Corticium candelabrum]
MLLGDLGADVIKIEKPGSGDDTRSWGPPFVGDNSTYFLSVNRNKKSVAVDIKHPDGQQILQQLISQSDVVVENFIPGKLDSLGLGYSSITTYNPSIIYCSISGYGPTGPYAKRAGYDVIASAVGGLMNITGPHDGEPAKVGVAITDLATGLYAQGAIMAALLHRQTTGKGQKIDCNLLSTQVACLVNVASAYLNAEVEPRRWGTAHANIVPYEAFRTAGGSPIVVGAGNNQHFDILCNVMGVEHLKSDERFSDNSKRVQHRTQLISELANRFLELTTGEWLDRLDGCGIPYGPINTMEQVFTDPQVRHSQLVREIEQNDGNRVHIIGHPVQYSDVDPEVRLPPPLLGEHTEEILLSTLGYDRDTVDTLNKSRTIQLHAGEKFTTAA